MIERDKLWNDKNKKDFSSVVNSQNLPRTVLDIFGCGMAFKWLFVSFWANHFRLFSGHGGAEEVETLCTRFLTSICFRVFLSSVDSLRENNAPPTSSFSKIPAKGLTECLHEIFTVDGRQQRRILCCGAVIRGLLLRCMPHWAWRCCWWHDSWWRNSRWTRTCCWARWIGHVEWHSHYYCHFSSLKAPGQDLRHKIATQYSK